MNRTEETSSGIDRVATAPDDALTGVTRSEGREHHAGVKITLGQPVHSTDGPFGDLADVVVDPRVNTVTHIVVEPHRRHHQARLVPMNVVEFVDGVIRVELDEAHVRSLQRVAESDFVPIYQPIDLGDDWDVGIEHIISVPYDEFAFDGLGGIGSGRSWSNHVVVDYDRIPRGECEIRHDSHVMSSDDHVVGLVGGMVLDDDHVEGVLVETGIVGFRHLVAIPIGVVARVRSDTITLTIDKAAFKRLPPVEDPDGSGSSLIARCEHRMAATAKRIAAGIRP